MPEPIPDRVYDSKFTGGNRIGGGHGGSKAKSSLTVRKDAPHGGKLITGRRKFSVDVQNDENSYNQYKSHDDDILNSKDFIGGSYSGAIRELDESKETPSLQPNDTFGLRSLGPWKNNPIVSQAKEQSHN